MSTVDQLRQKLPGLHDLVEKSQMRAVDTPKNTVILLGALVAVALLTLVNVTFYFHLAILICIWAGIAVSLDVLSGYAGQISIAHAAFMAAGAYTSAILTVDYGVPVAVGILLAGIVTMVIALLLGYPSFRTEGHYFVLVTIAIAILAVVFLNSWSSVTGGPTGMLGIPSPELSISVGGFTLLDLGTRQGYFYFAAAYLVATILIANNILDSRIGRTYIAVRDNHELAQSHGIHTKHAKLSALGVSCFFAGVGGALYAHYLGFINPEMFDFFHGFEVLVMLIIGGLGSLIGAIFGAIILVLTPELLRGYPDVSLLIFGFVLIVVVLFFPGGIWGFIKKYSPLG